MKSQDGRETSEESPVLEMTPMVSGRSQEDTAHPARVHRADEEQLGKYAKED